MSAQFTPGPWQIETDVVRVGDIDIVGADLADVAMVCVREKADEDGVPRETALANARLMAASPDMYTALQQVEFVIGTLVPTEQTRAAILSSARAALAKAEGR